MCACVRVCVIEESTRGNEIRNMFFATCMSGKNVTRSYLVGLGKQIICAQTGSRYRPLFIHCP